MRRAGDPGSRQCPCTMPQEALTGGSGRPHARRPHRSHAQSGRIRPHSLCRLLLAAEWRNKGTLWLSYEIRRLGCKERPPHGRERAFASGFDAAGVENKILASKSGNHHRVGSKEIRMRFQDADPCAVLHYQRIGILWRTPAEPTRSFDLGYFLPNIMSLLAEDRSSVSDVSRRQVEIAGRAKNGERQRCSRNNPGKPQECNIRRLKLRTLNAACLLIQSSTCRQNHPNASVSEHKPDTKR